VLLALNSPITHENKLKVSKELQTWFSLSYYYTTSFQHGPELIQVYISFCGSRNGSSRNDSFLHGKLDDEGLCSA
jgi:hypothetical protein